MNDIRFGDGENDIEAEAAAAALSTYQQSIREQTREHVTDRQSLVCGLLAGLMHHGDRTDADFSQALTDAAREHAEHRHEEPFYVGATIDDGQRLGVITEVNWETPEDFSYEVRFLGSGDTDSRLSGEIALADLPAIELSGYKVHTFARAQEELAQLQAAINVAAATGNGPVPRDVQDRELLLTAVSEWARVPAADVLSQLSPRIDEHTVRLRNDAHTIEQRHDRSGESAELAHEDFPLGIPPACTESGPSARAHPSAQQPKLPQSRKATP